MRKVVTKGMVTAGQGVQVPGGWKTALATPTSSAGNQCMQAGILDSVSSTEMRKIYELIT